MYRALMRTLILCAFGGFPTFAQTATYHLRREASTTSGRFQLKTNALDAAMLAIQTEQLGSDPASEYVIKEFDTATGVPGTLGAVPASSTVSPTLWMRKTANVGTLCPRARLYLNGPSGIQLCTAAERRFCGAQRVPE